MDEFDLAQEHEAKSRNIAIALVQAKASKPSLTHCSCCGEIIPQNRRSIGGVTRCFECQHQFEKKQTRYA